MEGSTSKIDAPDMATSTVRSHILYYGAALAATLLSTAVFLASGEAGPNWALNGLPLDDTWIHLVYARNFAELGWFFYNAGSPAAGMSSPLWVVLAAIPLKAGIEPVTAIKSLSILFGFLTAIVVYHLTYELSNEPIVAWSAGLFIALVPNFAFARVSGMEVTLLAFLLVLAIYLIVRKSYLLFGLTLGLAVVTRGEAAVFGIMVGSIVLAQAYLQREKLVLITNEELKLASQLFLPAALLGGAWALFNYTTAGTFLPST